MRGIAVWSVWLIVLSAAACGKGPAGHKRLGSRAGWAPRIPPESIAVLGYRRAGSEADVVQMRRIVEANLTKRAPPGLIPTCMWQVVAAIEHASLAVKPSPFELVISVHGKDLRSAFEKCARDVADTGRFLFEAEETGAATRYGFRNQARNLDTTIFVLWLDGDTALLSPFEDAKATATLAEMPVAAPDSPAAALLARVDGHAPLWASVRFDGRAWALSDLPGMFHLPAWPLGVHGAVSPSDATRFALTLEMQDDEQAEKTSQSIRNSFDPAAPQARVEDVRVEQVGPTVTITASLAPLLRTTIDGGEPAPPSAGIATLAVWVTVLVHTFISSSRSTLAAEAPQTLWRLYGAVSAYHKTHGKLPPTADLTPVPPGSCCGKPGRKCLPDATQWSGEGWKALEFVPDRPHYYSYAVLVGDGAFTVRALGDLDCDGTTSTFELVGKVGADGTIGKPERFFQERMLE